ncbi:MAG: glutathione S-transferase family protein [Caulobacter sp.]|nr:glutathione S-transferase family protein [Caulobacter sp.]
MRRTTGVRPGQDAEAFRRLNPNRQVPVLEDGNFVLTECSAILKYLAERSGSAAYPADLRARALVNSRMDWINTGLARDGAYGLAYPAMLPEMGLPGAEAQAALAHRSRQGTERWMAVLDHDWIGDRAFICGQDITLADYLGAAYVSLIEAVGFDLTPYRSVSRWLTGLKRRPAWDEAYAAFNGMLAAFAVQARQTA